MGSVVIMAYYMNGSKKVKKPKDTNAPKRPQSSYFLFMNERRPILRKQHSDKPVTEIAKLIAAEWKTMSDKTEYIEKAAALKEEYKIELEQYKKTSNYRKYQRKLEQWKEEEKEAKKAENKNNKSTKRKTRTNKNKKKTKFEESDSDYSANGESVEESETDYSESSGDGSSESDSYASDETQTSSESDSDYHQTRKTRKNSKK